MERKAIEAAVDEEDPNVIIADDQIRIDTSGDLRIHVPTGVTLSLDAGGAQCAAQPGRRSHQCGGRRSQHRRGAGCTVQECRR
ncbi:MAG: hypothetical protein R2856_19215 [Caldilineaceae bacterium]